MLLKAFEAEVANGQLRFQESLADLEGQHVLVTVGLDQRCRASDESLTPVPDPELLEDFDVEHDECFRMPFRWEAVKVRLVNASPLRPCLVLPEGSADE